jgi:hypothetical protein
MPNWIFEVEVSGAPVTGDGAIQPALVFQSEAQVIAGIREVWLDGQCLFETPDGFVRQPLFDEDQS